MKQFLLSLLILFSSFCWGQEVRILPLSWELKDFSIRDNETGKLTIVSTKHVVTFKSDLTAPALPYLSVKVLISPLEEYESSTLKGTDILVSEGKELSANPLSLPDNSLLQEQLCTIATYEELLYPSRSVEYIGTCMMNGFKMLSFMVCPFVYDAQKNRLLFKKDITLTVVTKGQVSTGETECLHNGIKEIAVNGNDIERMYGRTTKATDQLDSNSQSFEYIIVTNETLKQTFQKLANWKTQKGVPTIVLTTEEINCNYPGSTLQLKIKNALKSYYDNSQQALTYVLLGGDADVVPTQKCYVKYWHNNPYTVYETLTPTDLFYACFDTMEWDNNNNGIYGELNDSVDVIPEIYVTRASVRNVSDAEVFVSRIISYETNPEWNIYNNKALMSGSKTHVMYNNNTVSDAQYKSEWLYNYYIAPYWNGTKVRFYDTDTDFGGASYQVNPDNLQSQLTNGYGFVHIETHGEPSGWNLENSTFYGINRSSTLDNNGRTVVLTAACHTTAFDSLTTCLSESFMRSPNSGILAYVGSSRFGWYQPGISYLGPSNTLNGEIFKRMFSQVDNNFGKIVAEAKNAVESFAHTYEDMYRWLLYSVNPMGDPEMPIFTTIPQIFDSATVTCNGNILSVDANTSGCRICITGRNNTTFLLAKNTNTYNSPSLPDGEYNVCITKPGYIPLNVIVGLNQDIYIQNDTLSSINYSAPNVYIGKDINPSVTQGPVVVENGIVGIKLQDGVLIKNDFEVKEGAVFEIKQ